MCAPFILIGDLHGHPPEGQWDHGNSAKERSEKIDRSIDLHEVVRGASINLVNSRERDLREEDHKMPFGGTFPCLQARAGTRDLDKIVRVVGASDLHLQATFDIGPAA